MKKRIISILLALILICGISCYAYAESAANEARNGAVRIVQWLSTESGDTAYSLGSGFFIGKKGANVQYILTNRHVVEDYLDTGEGATFQFKDDSGYKHTGQMSVRVYFDADNYQEAYVIDSDANQDIAVLKIETPTNKRSSLALKIPTEDMVGDTVYVVGYPGADFYLNSTSAWGKEDSLVSKGTIGRLYTESGTGAKWIQSSDLIIAQGNSGGPFVSEDGYVIGMACWGLAGDVSDNMNMGVNIERVIEMLRKNSIEFDMASDRANAQKPAATAKPAAATTAPVAQTKAGMDTTTLAVIIAGAVILAAVVVGIIIKSRKSKAAAAAAAQEIPKTVPAKPVKQLTPVVRSLSSQHGGKKVKIGKEPTLAGRSKDCKIIYDESTPGVSGRHCAITWDDSAKEFIIKDLNSTYGTFLDSGMKLDSSRAYRLKPGDSFYLGEKANMLRVEVE